MLTDTDRAIFKRWSVLTQGRYHAADRRDHRTMRQFILAPSSGTVGRSLREQENMAFLGMYSHLGLEGGK